MVQQMNDKIAFLNRYTLSSKNKVEFITDKSTIVNAPIPEYWKAAFLADTLEDTWNNFECDYFKTRQKWGKND